MRAKKNPDPYKVIYCKKCKQDTIHRLGTRDYPRFHDYECMLCGSHVTAKGPDYDWWKGLGAR